MANFKGYKIQLTKGQDISSPQSFQEISFNPEGGYYASGGGEQPNMQPAQVNRARGGVVNAVVAGVATRALQFGVSNYGNLTGDYHVQAKIESIIEIGGLAAMAATGPIGATTAIMALTLKEVNRQIDIAKQNQATDLLRQRTGMQEISGGRR